MKKPQINALQKMLEDENTKGKKLIERVLWLNTTAPKYKAGEHFVVTDRGHQVYGYPVKDFKAKIVDDIPDSVNREYRYELEAFVKCGNKETTVRIFLHEWELKNCKKCKNNVNVLGDAKAEAVESLSLSW